VAQNGKNQKNQEQAKKGKQKIESNGREVVLKEP
jgi:hypothetical protein